jgi:hypothetical protein
MRLLKQVVNEAAGEKTPEAYPLEYVEDFFELRTKLGACFSNRLEVAYGALKDGNLRHRIAGRFQFCANLLFEVGGVAHAVDQEVEKPFDWYQALGLKLFHDIIADGHVAAPHVEYHIVVTIFPDAFES